MLNLTSKAAKILFAIFAGIVVHFIWRNTGKVIDLLDISRTTILGQSIRAVLLTLSVLILTAVAVKPKKIFSFLGLDGNILRACLIINVDGRVA